MYDFNTSFLSKPNIWDSRSSNASSSLKEVLATFWVVFGKALFILLSKATREVFRVYYRHAYDRENTFTRKPR